MLKCSGFLFVVQSISQYTLKALNIRPICALGCCNTMFEFFALRLFIIEEQNHVL